jgi:hypothetical protein
MRQIDFIRMILLLLGINGGLALHGQAAGIDGLVEADTLEQIATGFTFTEGPVWHAQWIHGLTLCQLTTVLRRGI